MTQKSATQSESPAMSHVGIVCAQWRTVMLRKAARLCLDLLSGVHAPVSLS